MEKAFKIITGRSGTDYKFEIVPIENIVSPLPVGIWDLAGKFYEVYNLDVEILLKTSVISYGLYYRCSVEDISEVIQDIT